MLNFELKDGTLIELTSSDSYTGPGKAYGLRVGSANWYRVNGGEWKRSIHRNTHTQVKWIEVCDTLSDFLLTEQEE